ncbi:hypothetical protein HJC23_005439 [Cyclotella cryptica]|uniref:JmjC domain-containing protein n=1 Tax=Cyclotella cryptica TaxID=29204 RepID=A0ABD3P4U1_9STRA|eukprot:CCRYP_017908-RA/>CCRYP_017908-RA protein AED:0.20 eAED:0.21 QI:0/-1/0/1/-1/1/1/0/302
MSHYQVQKLWNGVTPILSTNLVNAGIVDPTFNDVLTRVAVAAFDELSKTRRNEQVVHHSSNVNGGEIAPNSGGTTIRRRRRQLTNNDSSHNSKLNAPTKSVASSMNNNFFEYQRTHGYRLAMPSISNCKSVQRLEEDLFMDASIHFLKHAVSANRVAKQVTSMGGEFSIDMWAAVQRGPGAYHAFHVHEGAIVSGVYYSACPVGCAPLVLRKPLLDGAPNDDEEADNESKNEMEANHKDDVVIHPKEGDLIVFPPWLKHGVPLANEARRKDEAVASDKSRVSWAFNLTARLANIGNPWDITR